MNGLNKLANALNVSPDALIEALGTMTTAEVLELSDHAQRPTRKRKSMADRMRENVATLREESDTQTRLMSGVLGAAAQLADNNDILITEAVEAAEDALND